MTTPTELSVDQLKLFRSHIRLNLAKAKLCLAVSAAMLAALYFTGLSVPHLIVAAGILLTLAGGIADMEVKKAISIVVAVISFQVVATVGTKGTEQASTDVGELAGQLASSLSPLYQHAAVIIALIAALVGIARLVKTVALIRSLDVRIRELEGSSVAV